MIIPHLDYALQARQGRAAVHLPTYIQRPFRWEFINWEFEERVYTSAIIQDNELIITSTEPWRYDGTYIQLPDICTDGEGE